MNAQVNEYTCEWMRNWMNAHVNECTCEWMHMWMNAQVNVCTLQWMRNDLLVHLFMCHALPKNDCMI